MKVNDCDIRFQLDTGADVNIITSNFVRKEQVIPTKISLTMWNGSKSQPLGEATLDVCSLKDNNNNNNFIFFTSTQVHLTIQTQ